MASSYLNIGGTNSGGDVDQVLKDLYDANFPTLFNNETVLLNRLERSSVGFTGKQWVAPVHTARNSGVGPRGETGISGELATGVTSYLPAPGSQSTDQATLTPKSYYARFGVSGLAIDQADNMGAVIDILTFEMNAARRDLAKSVNRAFFGDGSGAVAQAASDNGVTPALYAMSGTGSAVGHLWLDVGSQYCFGSLTDGSSTGSNVVLNSVSNNGTNDTATFASDPANDSGDGVFPQGVSGNYAEAFGAGISGLNLALSTSTGADLFSSYSQTTYAGIAKSVAAWQTSHLDGSGGLNTDIMTQAQQDMRYGNGTLSLIIGHPVQWRTYGLLAGNVGPTGSATRRWEGNQSLFDAGFQALDFNGVPFVADLDCPKDRMFFLDETTFTILETKPPHFLNKGAGILTQVGSGSSAADLWEATLCWRLELFCNNPKANVVIKDLPY